MIGIVVVTHGQLARELVAAAEMIVGDDLPNATAVSVGWFDAADEARSAILAAVERVSGGGGGVVLLTDMFGGTPSNLSLSLLADRRVEVVTGVNLPMLIRLVSIREEEQVSLAQAAREAVAQGKENIYRASELLAASTREPAAPPEGPRRRGRGTGKAKAGEGESS